MARWLLLVVCTAAAASLAACDDGSSGEEGGGGGGPPLDPTFANVRSSVFVSCGFSSCHDTAQRGFGGVVIREEEEFADAVYDNLVNAPASTDVPYDRALRPPPNVPVRVVPGDPQASFLYWKILGHDPSDEATPVVGDPMPISGFPMSPDRLDLVKRWIEAGAPRE